MNTTSKQEHYNWEELISINIKLIEELIEDLIKKLNLNISPKPNLHKLLNTITKVYNKIRETNIIDIPINALKDYEEKVLPYDSNNPPVINTRFKEEEINELKERHLYNELRKYVKSLSYLSIYDYGTSLNVLIEVGENDYVIIVQEPNKAKEVEVVIRKVGTTGIHTYSIFNNPISSVEELKQLLKIFKIC